MEDIVLQTIRSDYFRQEFKIELKNIDKRRRDAIKNSGSHRLKSSPYGILEANNLLTYEFMSNEFLLILMRKSTLPAAVRRWISDFMTMLFYKTLEYVRVKKEEVTKSEIIN